MRRDHRGRPFANNVVVGRRPPARSSATSARRRRRRSTTTTSTAAGPRPTRAAPTPPASTGNISADPRIVARRPDARLPPAARLAVDRRRRQRQPSTCADRPRRPAPGHRRRRRRDGRGRHGRLRGADAWSGTVSPDPVHRLGAADRACPLDGLGGWVYPVNEPTAADGPAGAGLVLRPLLRLRERRRDRARSAWSPTPTASSPCSASSRRTGRRTTRSCPSTGRRAGSTSRSSSSSAPGRGRRGSTTTPPPPGPTIGTCTRPADWGRLAPASITAVTWLGPVAGDCAAYPRADVAFYAPFGFVGGVGQRRHRHLDRRRCR